MKFPKKLALSPFKQAIFDTLLSSPNHMADTMKIAQVAFGEKWNKRSSRGALVANIRRYCLDEPSVFGVLPAQHKYDSATIFLVQDNK